MLTRVRAGALRALNVYDAALVRRPLLVKCATYTGVLTAADVSAQLAFERVERWDRARTARFAAIGAVLIAPASHVWFNVLEKVVRSPPTLTSTVLKKVALEQSVLSPAMVLAVLVPNELAVAPSAVAMENVRAKLMPTWAAAVGVWGTVGLVNYRFVPVRYRVVFMCAVSLCWNTFLSIVSKASPRPAEKRLAA